MKGEKEIEEEFINIQIMVKTSDRLRQISTSFATYDELIDELLEYRENCFKLKKALQKQREEINKLKGSLSNLIQHHQSNIEKYGKAYAIRKDYIDEMKRELESLRLNILQKLKRKEGKE